MEVPNSDRVEHQNTKSFHFLEITIFIHRLSSFNNNRR